MFKDFVMLVGPAGSGKSTMARQFHENEGYTHINQDAQGRPHLAAFEEAILAGKNVICDRMNFTRGQRDRYLSLAKKHGYETKIIVLHESFETCLERCLKRQDHETIKEESAAKGALNMFFSKYERVNDFEADVVERRWPAGEKPLAFISDLDGTLCNVDHRLSFVYPSEGQKKNWKGFFDAMSGDSVNKWCEMLLTMYAERGYPIVLCSGRPDSHRKETEEWLKANGIGYDQLFMRNRSDHRQDDTVKQNILDFEILTRFQPKIFIDDRQQVVDMWRSRGYVCLQCAPGNF